MNELNKKIGGTLISEPEIKVVNIVATISFGKIEGINLLELLDNYNDVSYNPEKFPGAILRLTTPKASFLIFSNGKLIISGVKSTDLLNKAVQKVLSRFKKIGIRYDPPETKIVNMIGVTSIANFLDLNLFSLYLESSLYDPTIFPGLIYHMEEPKASFLLFSTGKIICTGVKDRETLYKAISKLKDTLQTLKNEVISSDTFDTEEYSFI